MTKFRLELLTDEQFDSMSQTEPWNNYPGAFHCPECGCVVIPSKCHHRAAEIEANAICAVCGQSYDVKDQAYASLCLAEEFYQEWVDEYDRRAKT